MNRSGYTLLEVSLFLAISGGLTLVALVGLAPRLNNVRFTSAMKGLQENVAKQISASQLGDNSDNDSYDCVPSGNTLQLNLGDSNSSSCVFVGRLAVFGVNRVDYRPIIALRQSTCPASDPFSLDAIKDCSLARVLDVDTNFQYSNGISRSSPATVGFGFVKSPDNNSVHRFIIESPTDGQFQLNSIPASPTDKDVCYNLSNRTAKLSLSTTRQEPVLEFNGVCS